MKNSDDLFVTIRKFMRDELNLKGYELIIYAIIYGFSKSDGSWFKGSARYMSEWTGSSEKTVLRALMGICDKGIVNKREFRDNNGYRHVWYRTTRKSDDIRDELSDDPTDKMPGPTDKMPFGQGTKCPSLTDKMSVYIDNNNDSNTYKYSPFNTPQFDQIVGRLNEKAHTRYRSTSESTRRLIRARLREGFGKEDFFRVIDYKCSEWGNDPKMRAYLRPQTLFGTKFESYLNSATSTGGVSDDWSAYR